MKIEIGKENTDKIIEALKNGEDVNIPRFLKIGWYEKETTLPNLKSQGINKVMIKKVTFHDSLKKNTRK